MRVQVVDPSAYTPPYDHSLCAALARAGAQTELVTSRFPYGERPSPDGYAVRELFYRHAVGPAGSSLRRASKLLEHAPDMLRYRRLAAQADVVHFQWLAVQWLDRHLLPARPTVLTAHDLLPREPRPLQSRAQRRLYDAVDAIVVHSEYGRRQLVERLGIPEQKVSVIHHGAFEHLAAIEGATLPPELDAAAGAPVVLFFGLLRPYKGLELLLSAWSELERSAGGERAELWVVGRPRIEIAALRARASTSVRFVPRFVSDRELAACFRRADAVVLPYLATERLDFSGVLATALAFGKPAILSDVGGFSELAESGAALLVPAGQQGPLADALATVLRDHATSERLAHGARAAAAGPYSWTEAARRTLALYATLLA